MRLIKTSRKEGVRVYYAQAGLREAAEIGVGSRILSNRYLCWIIMVGFKLNFSTWLC